MALPAIRAPLLPFIIFFLGIYFFRESKTAGGRDMYGVWFFMLEHILCYVPGWIEAGPAGAHIIKKWGGAELMYLDLLASFVLACAIF